MDDKGTIWEKMNSKQMHYDDEIDFDEEFGTPGNSETAKTAIMIAIIAITIISMVTITNMCIVKVEATDFVICQTALSDRVQVLDRPGFHFRPLAKTWTFKRYSTIKMENNCMFQDGRFRKVETYIRVQLPESTESRIKLYQRFNGQMHNIEEAIDIVVTIAMRMAAISMGSHNFDIDGKPEIVRLVQTQITKALAHYDLTLSDFGIYNATIPPDEVPQGAAHAEIQDAMESHQRQVQEAIEDAEAARYAWMKRKGIYKESPDGEN